MSAADVAQSVLAPAGIQASSIEHLWRLLLWTCTIVFVCVMSGVFLALARGMRNRSREDAAPASERVVSGAVSAAVAATVVILLVLLTASVWTGRALASLQASSAVSIAITGHQWWWEIEYEDASADRRVITANELHIPVARPVVLKLTSRDVIHSFWAPNLHGKRDLIPGYTTALWLQADRPGTFWGQCAEFCGLQHAHMALQVVAEPDAEFQQWLAAMRQPAPPASDSAQRRGQDVFMRSRCAGCHSIRGTDAWGQVGPDLTHIASRATVGARTLDNTADHLAAWVRDPQRVKPGNQMPPSGLAADDLQALVTYLEALR